MMEMSTMSANNHDDNEEQKRTSVDVQCGGGERRLCGVAQSSLTQLAVLLAEQLARALDDSAIVVGAAAGATKSSRHALRSRATKSTIKSLSRDAMAI